MKNLFPNIKTEIIEYLQNSINEINKIKIIEEKEFILSYDNFKNDKYIENFFNNLSFENKSNNFVYKFYIQGGNNYDYQNFNSSLEKFKKVSNIYSTSRLLNIDNPKSLYVGSSSTKLKQRLKCHLGYGYKGTYALHLKEWIPNINKKISLNIIQLEEQTSRDSLQLIEDFYWIYYKPLFGKKGGQ